MATKFELQLFAVTHTIKGVGQQLYKSRLAIIKLHPKWNITFRRKLPGLVVVSDVGCRPTQSAWIFVPAAAGNNVTIIVSDPIITTLRPVGAPLGAIRACIEEPVAFANAFRAQGRSYKNRISSTLKAPFHMGKAPIYA